MNVWPFPVGSHTRDEIAECVAEENWQQFRKYLKGKSTQQKLELLGTYYHVGQSTKDEDGARRIRVRVDNYINALKRGGQLKEEGGYLLVQR